METKLNIAEILKDKPQDTKLYSPLFGDVYLLDADNNIIRIKYHEEVIVFFGDGRYYNYPESEPLLFPSKEIRDWSIFAWKKGDVLMADVDNICIFDKWNNDEYTEFDAAFVTLDYRSDVLKTKYWHKVIGEKVIKRYISKIERNNGGKLNLTTLELEKTQHKFKDGDIITFKDRIIIIYNTSIEKSPKRTEIYYHACLKEGELTINEYLMSCGFGEGWYSSTEEEKQQLFDALANINKAWDAEKKQIIDLKPKVELKPFDKVLVRDSKSDYWRATLFSHINENGCYYCVWAGWTYCIPYEGNEHLLGTNKDVEG